MNKSSGGDSPSPVILNYRPPYRTKRYTRKSILTLIVGIFSGPIIAAPLILTLKLTSEYSDTRFWLIMVSLAIGGILMFGIPWIGFREAARLRNQTTGDMRGTKLIRFGLMFYVLWIIAPLAMMCFPVVILFFFAWPTTTMLICRSVFSDTSWHRLIDRWRI